MKTIIILTIILSTAILSAQDKMIASEKIPLALKLSFYKKPSDSRMVTATLTKEKNNKKGPAVNVKVSFYAKDSATKLFLTVAYTDLAGSASIEVYKNLPRDRMGIATIVARVEEDSLYESVKNQISIKEANLILSLSEVDAMRTAKARLTQVEPHGGETPVPEAEVNFYVQRLFGVMPAGEEYTASTDENGEASLPFPNNIPGDKQGNLTVVARLEENELFGNVEAQADAKWGVSVPVEKDPFPSAIWEPRAPIEMIITFSVLFGGVWITYCFVFYQLFKVKKEI